MSPDTSPRAPQRDWVVVYTADGKIDLVRLAEQILLHSGRGYNPERVEYIHGVLRGDEDTALYVWLYRYIDPITSHLAARGRGDNH